MEPDFSGLWQCPECGERFVTRKLWHSCGRYALDALFARSEPHLLPLFRRFADMVASCGPVRVIPQKTRVVFQVQVRFAGIIPRKRYLSGHLWLTRRCPHPRFLKIEKYAPRCYSHLFRLRSVEDLDQQLMAWIRESYKVGQRLHLRKAARQS